MCTMAELKEHLTSLVTDMCKSQLHFSTGFHFQGLVGVTLDDRSVLLLDIRNSYYKTDGLRLVNKDSSTSVKAQASQFDKVTPTTPWPGQRGEENSLTETQSAANADHKVLAQPTRAAPQNDFIIPYLKMDQARAPLIVGDKSSSGQGPSVFSMFGPAATVDPHPEKRQSKSDAGSKQVSIPLDCLQLGMLIGHCIVEFLLSVLAIAGLVSDNPEPSHRDRSAVLSSQTFGSSSIEKSAPVQQL